MNNKRQRNKSRAARKKSNSPAVRNKTPSNQSASHRSAKNGDVEYTISTAFQGPLPPPEMLEHYNSIVPGFAERLLDEYTAQGSHRRNLEAAVITSDIGAQNRGQWIGAVMFGMVVVAAVVLGVVGAQAAAVAVVTIDIAGFGGIYVFGRRRQERERGEVRE